MSLTLAQLQAAIPAAGHRAAIYLEALNDAMAEFGITSPLDQAAFIAQAAHESMSLVYVREVWGPTPAQNGYEGRADLGNTHVGDGKRFLGRGFFQITGRTNTIACLMALGRPEDDVTYLETPIGACRSAGWFWKTRDLGVFAGKFGTITKKINGGYNGLDDRIEHYVRARRALGV